MDQLENQITARVAAARSSLASAAAAGDDYLVTVREGELESLARLAVAHGFVVPDDTSVAVEKGQVDLTALEQRESA